MTESEDLFTIRNDFYSGLFSKVIETDFDLASEVAQGYILRSYLSLGQYETVVELASQAPHLKSFEYYAEYLLGDDVVSEDLESLVENSPSTSTVILGALYYIKAQKGYEKALNLLEANLNWSAHDDLNLELGSLAVQIYLLLGDLTNAVSFLKKFGALNINDSVVYSYATSLVSLVQGSESTQLQTFYFFEEITQTNRSLKNLVYLLVIHLTLGHFPESLQIVEQVDALSESLDPENYLTFLINKAKLLIISNDTEGAEKLINEKIMTSEDQKHPFIVDLKEKNQLFDEVVLKYSK